MSRIIPAAAITLAGSALLAFMSPGNAAEQVIKAPAPAMVAPAAGHRETAIFAGGCFWGVEGVFSHVKGVVGATSGYAGGNASTANYETVSTGSTGHAESVQVVFDPAQVNYADLLRIYFSVVADPTQVNRQGPDTGTQYRSALFPLSLDQEKVARAYIAQLSAAHVYARPIRNPYREQARLLPGRGLSSGFHGEEPDLPVHCRQ